ncbi:hypothetical protein PanWU01x14_142550 [Parasponia andersonii]|uniref:Uncharacterized protein n=1 Tax=Parasponia andersonii TaxID=3476 RepID=A0A2P5CLA6_PARAD|nr:hypothetical protein PanWU01x14_142550 [Parasponia andersonii]
MPRSWLIVQEVAVFSLVAPTSQSTRRTQIKLSPQKTRLLSQSGMRGPSTTPSAPYFHGSHKQIRSEQRAVSGYC